MGTYNCSNKLKTAVESIEHSLLSPKTQPTTNNSSPQSCHSNHSRKVGMSIPSWTNKVWGAEIFADETVWLFGCISRRTCRAGNYCPKTLAWKWHTTVHDTLFYDILRTSTHQKWKWKWNSKFHGNSWSWSWESCANLVKLPSLWWNGDASKCVMAKLPKQYLQSFKHNSTRHARILVNNQLIPNNQNLLQLPNKNITHLSITPMPSSTHSPATI